LYGLNRPISDQDTKRGVGAILSNSHGLSGYRTGEFQLEGALRDVGGGGRELKVATTNGGIELKKS
jgi:hypothetical protein